MIPKMPEGGVRNYKNRKDEEVIEERRLKF